MRVATILSQYERRRRMKKGIWKEGTITIYKPVYQCPFCFYKINDDGYPPYYCGCCGARLYENEQDMKEGEEE